MNSSLKKFLPSFYAAVCASQNFFSTQQGITQCYKLHVMVDCFTYLFLAFAILLEAARGFVSSFVAEVLQHKAFVCVNNNSLHTAITQWDDRGDGLLAEMKYHLYL